MCAAYTRGKAGKGTKQELPIPAPGGQRQLNPISHVSQGQPDYSLLRRALAQEPFVYVCGGSGRI